MSKTDPRPLTPPPPRQLPLPLPAPPGPAPPWLPPGPAPPWLPPALAALPAQRIWANLTPAAQAQVRATALRVIQEVLDDRHRP